MCVCMFSVRAPAVGPHVHPHSTTVTTELKLKWRAVKDAHAPGNAILLHLCLVFDLHWEIFIYTKILVNSRKSTGVSRQSRRHKRVRMLHPPLAPMELLLELYTQLQKFCKLQTQDTRTHIHTLICPRIRGGLLQTNSTQCVCV
jgi:hypothetical protein